MIDLSDTEMEVAGSDTSDYETSFSGKLYITISWSETDYWVHLTASYMYMRESFQDYSLIQDFEANFLWKVSLKSLIRLIKMAF